MRIIIFIFFATFISCSPRINQFKTSELIFEEIKDYYETKIFTYTTNFDVTKTGDLISVDNIANKKLGVNFNSEFIVNYDTNRLKIHFSEEKKELLIFKLPTLRIIKSITYANPTVLTEEQEKAVKKMDLATIDSVSRVIFIDEVINKEEKTFFEKNNEEIIQEIRIIAKKYNWIIQVKLD